MKFYFFLTALGVFFGSDAAFSQHYLTESPSVEFPKGIATEVAGMGDASKGVLNCNILLGKQWPYPNAQVTAFCNEAETGCLRYFLILKHMKKAKGEPYLTKLKRDASLAWNDTQVRLRGCELAIEASANNVDFMSDYGGKNSYFKKQKNY